MAKFRHIGLELHQIISFYFVFEPNWESRLPNQPFTLHPSTTSMSHIIYCINPPSGWTARRPPSQMSQLITMLGRSSKYVVGYHYGTGSYQIATQIWVPHFNAMPELLIEISAPWCSGIATSFLHLHYGLEGGAWNPLYSSVQHVAAFLSSGSMGSVNTFSMQMLIMSGKSNILPGKHGYIWGKIHF